mmetsp:Transcript_58516/g.126593  ORF Transcript_58516/g.126593 Transcript_58516/m.126593 type:complete len:402 (-) Transcript_58516:3719-4924(-)
MGLHGAWLQLGIVSLLNVQVVKALAWVLGITPLRLDDLLELLYETHTGATVACDVDPWKSALPCILRRFLEEDVLIDSEGASLSRHVVGDEHDTAALRILWRAHGATPGHHANVVHACIAIRLGEHAISPQHELLTLEHAGGHGCGAGQLLIRSPPLDQLNLHHSKELWCVGGACSSCNDAPRQQGAGREGVQRCGLPRLDVHPLLQLCGDRIFNLQQSECFEVLACHGRCCDSQSMLSRSTSRLAEAHFDHNLVHLHLLQTVTVLGHKLVQETLEDLVRFLGLKIHKPHQMGKDAAIGLRSDLRGEPRALKLIDARQQQVGWPSLPSTLARSGLHGVGDHSHEDSLGWPSSASLCHLACAKIHHGIASDGGDDPLQFVLLCNPVHLQEVRIHGLHIAAGR